MTVYLHLTPEKAMELAQTLLRVARDVNDAQNNREIPNAHEYINAGTTEEGNIKVRMRIGS